LLHTRLARYAAFAPDESKKPRLSLEAILGTTLEN